MDSSSWELKDENGNILWSCGQKKYPSSNALQRILQQRESVTKEFISSIAIQSLINSPTKSLPGILSALVCSYWRNSSGDIDVSMLYQIPNSSKRVMCGKPIKKGDILWNCRQCGHDLTCVQCDACFKLSDHTNHDVYFHRSNEGGGCCDCGDTEAWNKEGNCSLHGVKESDANIDPIMSLPPPLLDGISAVLDGIFLVASKLLCQSTNAFLSLQHNQYILNNKIENSSQLKEHFQVRLHNDDIHSYDDVTSALLACGIGISNQNAATLTTAVDKDGYAIAWTGNDLNTLTRVYISLAVRAELCVSIVPVKIALVEKNICQSLEWLMKYGGNHTGIMAITSSFYLQSLNDIFSRQNKLDPLNILDSLFYANDSSTGLNFTYPTLPFRSQGAIHLTPFEQTLYFTPSQVGVTFSPIVYTSYVVPNLFLSIFVALSPYQVKPLQTVLHDTIISFQQDTKFKLNFAEILILLYPHIMALFCSGIGTENESILRTSVQVLTAPSAIRMLSLDGYQSRYLLPHHMPTATVWNIITKCILDIVTRAGCDNNVPETVKFEVLSSFPFSRRRIIQCFRDLTHIIPTGVPGGGIFTESVGEELHSPVSNLFVYFCL